MRDSEMVTFGEYPLDRAAELRADPVELERLAAHPEALALPVWKLKPLVDFGQGGRLGFLPMAAEVFADPVGLPYFLGLADGAPRFAIDVSAWVDPQADAEAIGSFVDPTQNHHPSLPADLRFAELRAVMADLPSGDAAIAATARGIIGWHGTHAFCARCGAASVSSHGGWQRACPACGALHFPRTDPVVIMLITHGNDVLLGRSHGWPEGMYSLLAGFMEPGETIEAAVRREVAEEAGIGVGRVEYLTSQPWPFPSSLMIGCRGEALARDLTVDSKELADARWVGREAALDSLMGKNPAIRAARAGSIARFLLEAWLADRLG